MATVKSCGPTLFPGTSPQAKWRVPVNDVVYWTFVVIFKPRRADLKSIQIQISTCCKLIRHWRTLTRTRFTPALKKKTRWCYREGLLDFDTREFLNFKKSVKQKKGEKNLPGWIRANFLLALGIRWQGTTRYLSQSVFIYCEAIRCNTKLLFFPHCIDRKAPHYCRNTAENSQHEWIW